MQHHVWLTPESRIGRPVVRELRSMGACGARAKALGKQRNKLVIEFDGVSHEVGPDVELWSGRWPTNRSHAATRSASSHS